MRTVLSGILIISVFLVSSSFAAPFVERINSIPDITQTDPKYRFPHGGVHFCGPCAVSNSLAWLGENGYEQLLPNGVTPTAAVELAKLIASDKYIGTTLEYGSSPAGIIEGVARYIADSGFRYRELSYQGWRTVPARFHSGVKAPDLEWLKSGLKGDSAVWLNLGWYKYCPEEKEYLRVGGHWVTLVGFGIDQYGKENPDALIIHDPGSRSGLVFLNEFIRLKRIGEGTIVSASGLRQDAAGFYRIGGELKVSRDAQFGILDGAIRLEMEKPRT